VTATLISAAAWFFAEHRFLKSKRAHGWLTLVLPICLLSFVFHSKVHFDHDLSSPIDLTYNWRSWRYHPPDAQDFFADYILVTVSLVLAHKVTLLPVRDLRVMGVAIFGVAVIFLALEGTMLFRSPYAG
jgi:hypothetical protein